MAAFNGDITGTFNLKVLPVVTWDKKQQQKVMNDYDPRDVATQFPNRVLIDAERDEIFRWCAENIESQYHYDVIDFFSKPHIRYMRMCSFAKKEDAMAFKLTFT